MDGKSLPKEAREKQARPHLSFDQNQTWKRRIISRAIKNFSSCRSVFSSACLPEGYCEALLKGRRLQFFMANKRSARAAILSGIHRGEKVCTPPVPRSTRIYNSFLFKIHPFPDLFSAIFLLKKDRESAMIDRFGKIRHSKRNAAPCGADWGSGFPLSLRGKFERNFSFNHCFDF